MALSICFKLSANAQQPTKQEKGYFNLTEFGFFSGTKHEALNYGGNTATANNGAYAISLRNINGYFITNKLSVGLGVGMENYTLYDANVYDNMFLLFADARYYFKNANNTFFAFGDAGSSVALNYSFSKGPMFNVGGGYKFKVGNRTALTGAVGFSNQTIKQIAPNYKENYYGATFKIGLLL